VRIEGGHMRVDPEAVLTLLAVVDEAVALTEALVRVHNEDPYGYGAVTVQQVWRYTEADDEPQRCNCGGRPDEIGGAAHRIGCGTEPSAGQVVPQQPKGGQVNCTAAANQRGGHIPCDLDAEHGGWAHSNREHELIWAGPVGQDTTGEQQ
jgi:hypothetical protein